MKKYFVLTGKGVNVFRTIQKLNRVFAGIKVSIVELADIYADDKDFRSEVHRLSSDTKKKETKKSPAGN